MTEPCPSCAALDTAPHLAIRLPHPATFGWSECPKCGERFGLWQESLELRPAPDVERSTRIWALFAQEPAHVLA